MDGKDLISSPSSDLQSFYGQQRQLTHSPSSHHLTGMHSVIRPMPNMNILNSIALAGMQFHMDPPSLLHNNNNNMGSASGVSGPPGTEPPPPVKRKRGRPRKYGPDGSTMKASATAAAQQQHQMVSAPPRMEMLGSSPLEDHQAQKKKRGRPPGTGKKQHVSSPFAGNAFSGTAGTSFTPHIITASPSEDVAAKIVAFANQSAKAACVLSAMGSVSRVVLRHPADGSMSRVHASAPYKNPAIYEGFYEILSLSGSYSMSEGQQQSGGLSVTLCSPERNVIGGVLAGPLVAATTVQVVLGTFHQRSKSKKAGKQQAAFSPGSLTAGQEASGHNQNLTPPGWPSSGIFDTTSPNIDINSSRG